MRRAAAAGLSVLLGASLLAGPAFARRKAAKAEEPVPGPKIGRVHNAPALQGADGGRWWPAPVARELKQGERLRTGRKGEAILIFPDGALLRLLAGTECALETLKKDSISLIIDSGEAELWLELPKKTDFLVKTPSAEARLQPGVIRLRVEVDSKGGSVWEAFKGRLKIKDINRRKETVTAGTRQRVHYEMGLAGSEMIDLVSKMPSPPEMDYASIKPVPRKKSRRKRTPKKKPSKKRKKKGGLGVEVPELGSW